MSRRESWNDRVEVEPFWGWGKLQDELVARMNGERKALRRRGK